MMKRSWTDYVFLVLVGGMLNYALIRAIITSTIVLVPDWQLVLISLATLAFAFIILFNKYTIIASAVLFAVFVFIISRGFRGDPTPEEYTHFFELYLMVRGFMPYTQSMGITILWIISMMVSLLVVLFTFYKFNFTVLTIIAFLVLIITWLPGFTRDNISFLMIILSYALLLMRKMHRSTALVLVTVPLCAVVLLASNARIPQEHDLFERRELRDVFDGPIEAVGDFLFEIFNPMHFDFQTTGFTGYGGRLGGPVSPNNRHMMTVIAPGRTYLAGAVHNYFTGYSWTNALQPGDINTHGFHPFHFEKLETSAALLRYATISDRINFFIPEFLHEQLGANEVRQLSSSDFRTMGVGYDLTYYLHTYLPIAHVNIVIGQNRTGSIFRPPRTQQIWFHTDSTNYLHEVMVSPLGDMRVPRFMSRGTTYHSIFLDVNQNLSFIQNILYNVGYGTHALRYEETYEDQLQLLLYHPSAPAVFISPERGFGVLPINLNLQETTFHDDFTARDMAELINLFTSGQRLGSINYLRSEVELLNALNAFSMNVLVDYAIQVREHFMQVPEITPDRVHALTHEIVYGIDGDFNRVMAIREFLLQFPYTLSPPSVPRGVCFVDHFLFDAQMGYCTYFASAMALMSRIAGIPSRYVEGFVVPPSNDPHLPVNITNRMAHAWVEVYLEGFGWLTVEATPTYALLMDAEAPIRADGIFAANFRDGDWFDQWYDWYDYMDEDFPLHGWMGPLTTTPIADVDDGFVFDDMVPWLIGGSIFVFVGLLAFLIYRRLRVSIGLWNIAKKAPRIRVLAYYQAIQNIITYYTTPLNRSETPKRYGVRMGKRFAFQSDSVFYRDLIDLYYKARYSNADITDREAELMEDAYHDMLNLLKQMRWRPYFYFLRYIRDVGMVQNIS